MRPSMRMPDENALQPGPLRDLTAALYELYRRAGLVSSRVIRDWIEAEQDAPGSPSHTTVAQFLQGRSPRPKWLNVKSVALVLLKHGGASQEDRHSEIDRIHRLWISVVEPDRPDVLRSQAGRGDVVRATASHFARLSFDWGRGIRPDDGGYVHGSLAISCADTGPSFSYGGVFSPDFQWGVRMLQEQQILRRGGHRFNGHQDWISDSYLVYGDITETGYCSSFIGVEAHTYGAVSIYFREYTMDATLDEIVGWWIYGAWRIGLIVHALLGTTGPAHAAVMVDPAGISDLSVPDHESLVTAEHGPFPLWPGKGEDWYSLPDGLQDWARDAAEADVAAIRADMRRESTGTDWRRRRHQERNLTDEERNWTPLDVWDRLALGRRS